MLCVQDLNMISGLASGSKKCLKFLPLSHGRFFTEEWAADSGCRADVDFRLQVADFFFKSHVSLAGELLSFRAPR